MQTWTTKDFDRLSWHDCLVHGMHGFDSAELRLDLDYITQWVHPKAGEQYFSFWIAPATLVFHQAHDLRVRLDAPDFGDFVILRVYQEATPHDGVLSYRMETLGGEISLRASGFTQYLRSNPE